MLKKKKEQNKIKRRLKRSIHIETVICSFAIFFFFFQAHDMLPCFIIFFFNDVFRGRNWGKNDN